MTAPVSDLLLRNARIWSGNGDTRLPDTALIRDGRLAFVGRAQDANVPVGAEILDAGGRLVLPGFTDSHAHLLGTGLAMQSVDLKGVASVAEAVRRVDERVAATPAGAWVRSAGWDQHLWPGVRFPNRHDLDAVAPDHPVVLTHTSGHCIWVNSAALRAAGVTAATAVPAGGAIDADDDGEPTGILRDNASRLISDAAPKLTQTERITAAELAIAHAHSLGVTGVHAMDVGRGELQALHALNDSGKLHLRVRTFMSAGMLDEWIDRNLATGDGDEMLRIGGVKFFADGALGSMTAWMLEPCEGATDTGLALQPPGELERGVRRCLEHGLAPAIHAIGDRANREVLDILSRVRQLAPHLPRRIEHAQLLAPIDVARFAYYGVTASVQPIHATQDMAKVDRAWGARGTGAYAFASLRSLGVNLAFGSDTPVETMDPLAGVHAAATRRNAAGEPAGGWYPAQRLPIDAAITAYTAGAARATGEGAVAGRITAGYRADFVVLSENISEPADPMRILDARVDLTVIGGNVVYRRDTA
jgi:predicted amidohydrolase YtcJ